MKGTIIVGSWLAFAAIVAALALGVIAAGTARQELLDELREHAASGEPPRHDLEHAANEILKREIERSAPDWELATAAAAALGDDADGRAAREQAAQCLRAWSADARRTRRQLESGRVAMAALRVPDEAYLAAAAARHRLAPRDIQDVIDRAQRLRQQAGSADGDLAARDLAQRVAALHLDSDPAAWAASEIPPLAEALAQARAAAADHLAAILASYASPTDGQDALPRGVARVKAGDPGLAPRLREGWAALTLIGTDPRLEPALAATYSAATRRRVLPASAILIGLGCLALLTGGLLLAMRRVSRGPVPVDPGAETLENVEPIDLDPDAETLEARHRTHDTTAY